MSVLYVALPVAVMLGAAGLFACLYCIRDGQYDDLDTPAVRMLIDDPHSDERQSVRSTPTTDDESSRT